MVRGQKNRLGFSFRVYILHLLCLYQAYCTLVVRYCHVTKVACKRLSSVGADLVSGSFMT